MILKIDFKSGDPAGDHREFHLEAIHLELPADNIAPMLGYIVDVLASQHPEDVYRVVPMHVPELAGRLDHLKMHRGAGVPDRATLSPREG